LGRILIKKEVERDLTKRAGPETIYLRGNGKSDRSYHKVDRSNGESDGSSHKVDLQFHFYECSSRRKLKRAIGRLRGKYGLTINRELPDFLASDLASLV